MVKRGLAFTFFLALLASGQQEAQRPEGQPQIKLNYLNVCRPSAEEQGIIRGALSRIPGKPMFIEDFEITRGRVTLKDASPSKYVRLRRDFGADSPLMTAQYSISTGDKNMVEILVFRQRDAREFHEISMEDEVSAGAASPVSVLAMDTPVTRIRVERISKASVVLARCPDVDQGVYEPLLRQASGIMAQYRGALGLRTSFRSDIAWLSGPGKIESSSHGPAARAQK